MLSRDLYNRCCDILRECREFDNPAVLRAVFVSDELRPFQDNLPTGESKSERIQLAIAYLLPLRLRNERSVFPIFLDALRRTRSQEDGLYGQLSELYNNVEQELQRTETLTIPFVVMAMTREETNDLISGDAFRQAKVPVAPDEAERFSHFRSALEQHGVVDLGAFYGVDRESWRPHIPQQTAIHELVSIVIARLSRDQPELPILSPDYYSRAFFSSESSQRVQTARQFSRSGGVVIIDAVSLFHPGLRHTLLQSGVSANERVAMLVISPIRPTVITANQLIEDEIRIHMEQAFERFENDMDRRCEFGISDMRTFQRWMFAFLQDTASAQSSEKPNPLKRDLMRQKFGNPGGIGGLLFAK